MVHRLENINIKTVGEEIIERKVETLIPNYFVLVLLHALMNKLEALKDFIIKIHIMSQTISQGGKKTVGPLGNILL